jgi:hypothetical protein
VLARAEEIERGARQGDAWNAEVAAVIGAAEEVGLSRLAVERALAERLGPPEAPPIVGSLAWARSADGKFHVAEVLSISNEGTRVRFLRGSEHRLPADDVRPCALIPGARVVCHWPMWGPWTCTVIGYEADKQQVKLSDGWGDAKVFPLAEVWLAPVKAHSGAARRRVSATLLGAGGAVGALLGSIITALLMR